MSFIESFLQNNKAFMNITALIVLSVYFSSCNNTSKDFSLKDIQEIGANNHFFTESKNIILSDSIVNTIGLQYKKEGSSIQLRRKDLTENLQLGQLSSTGNITYDVRACHTPLMTLGKRDCKLIFSTDGFIRLAWIRYYSDESYGECKLVRYPNEYLKKDIVVNLESEGGKWTNIVFGFQCKDKSKSILEHMKLQDLRLEGDYGYNVENFFSVDVHTNNPLTKGLTSVKSIRKVSIDKDYCVCYIPESHSVENIPIKTVVLMHGGGENIDIKSTNITNYNLLNYLLKCGYAVVSVNGMAKQYAMDNHLTYSRPCGNWMATESVIKAIKYTVDEFNLDYNNLFLFGASQGGMTAMNLLDNSDILFRTTVLDSPVYSMYHSQLRISGALPTLWHFFGFNSAETFSVDKVIGCDPFTRNVDLIHEGDELISPNNPSSSAIIPKPLKEDDLKKIVGKRKFRGSVLFLSGVTDPLCPAVMQQIVVKQIRNMGGCAELILLDDIGHMIIMYTPKIGKLKLLKNELPITTGCKAVADWFYRFGGYKPYEFCSQ